jgi:hypothetical protein
MAGVSHEGGSAGMSKFYFGKVFYWQDFTLRN